MTTPNEKRNELEVGDKVICHPVIPGLEDVAGLQGFITERWNKAYMVKFGKKKPVLIGAIELRKI